LAFAVKRRNQRYRKRERETDREENGLTRIIKKFLEKAYILFSVRKEKLYCYENRIVNEKFPAFIVEKETTRKVYLLYEK
jgi:hypothetical protein